MKLLTESKTRVKQPTALLIATVVIAFILSGCGGGSNGETSNAASTCGGYDEYGYELACATSNESDSAATTNSNDLDGDGIYDPWDVTYTGGHDLNNDGQDDQSQMNDPFFLERCGGSLDNRKGNDPSTINYSWGGFCHLSQDSVLADSSLTTGVQRLLSCIGYQVELTHVYDAQTSEAIAIFQTDNSVDETSGEIKSETWKALKERVRSATHFGDRYNGFKPDFYDPDLDGIDNRRDDCKSKPLFLWENSSSKGSWSLQRADEDEMRAQAFSWLPTTSHYQ